MLFPLQNSFRVHGSRGDKQLYLFEKLLLICKKLDEGIFQFRDGLSVSDLPTFLNLFHALLLLKTREHTTSVFLRAYMWSFCMLGTFSGRNVYLPKKH